MAQTYAPSFEIAIERKAQQMGMTRDEFILEAITKALCESPEKNEQTGKYGEPLSRQSFVEYKSNHVPKDEWEAEILNMGISCGVALSDEALSSEYIYD